MNNYLSGIKHVFFDLGETLIKTVKFDFNAGQDSVCSALGIEKSADQFKTVQKELETIFTIRDNSVFEIDFRKHLKLSLNLLNIYPCFDFAELEKIFYKNATEYKLIEGVRDFLDWLKNEKQIIMGVISNNCFSSEILEYELKKQSIDQYFKIIISSCDYGIRKPSEYLFKLAMEKTGAEPEKSLFIGDKVLTDMEGAKKAGMHSLLFDPDNKYEYENVFSDYSELIR